MGQAGLAQRGQGERGDGVCRGPTVGREHGNARSKMQQGQRESELVSRGGRRPWTGGRQSRTPVRGPWWGLDFALKTVRRRSGWSGRFHSELFGWCADRLEGWDGGHQEAELADCWGIRGSGGLGSGSRGGTLSWRARGTQVGWSVRGLCEADAGRQGLGDCWQVGAAVIEVGHRGAAGLW